MIIYFQLMSTGIARVNFKTSAPPKGIIPPSQGPCIFQVKGTFEHTIRCSSINKNRWSGTNLCPHWNSRKSPIFEQGLIIQCIFSLHLKLLMIFWERLRMLEAPTTVENWWFEDCHHYSGHPLQIPHPRVLFSQQTNDGEHEWSSAKSCPRKFIR